jgi:regulator of protease activity HflC (stomatin/prohibitin superfamily)
MDKEINIPRLIVYGIATVILLVLVFGCFFTVSAGQIGIKTRFGAISGSYEQGLHFKMPLIEHVVKMDVQTQKEAVTGVQAASQDLQTVTTDVTLNYHLDRVKAVTVYQNVGTDYAARVIDPAVQESVKATTAQYTAEQLITKREDVRDGINALLTQKLTAFGLSIDAINITNFKFSSSFEAAIEAKVTAEQSALAAKNKLDQVKYEADQRIAQAQGEAEAIKIQSQAIESQGGTNYVALQAIGKWDGHYPATYMGAASGIPLISIPNNK